MNIIDSLNQTSDKAFDVGEEYYKKTQEYYKLKIFQQLTSSIGMFCKVAAIGSILFIALTVLVVAGIIALGAYLESMVLSCLVIAGVLLLVGMLTYRYRRRIDTMVIQKISKQFFD